MIIPRSNSNPKIVWPCMDHRWKVPIVKNDSYGYPYIDYGFCWFDAPVSLILNKAVDNSIKNH